MVPRPRTGHEMIMPYYTGPRLDSRDPGGFRGLLLGKEFEAADWLPLFFRGGIVLFRGDSGE